MFQSVTLGKKIGFGFAILSILTVAVGIVGYFGLTRVLSVTEFYQNTSLINDIVTSVKEETDQYLLHNYAEARKKQEVARGRAFAQIEKGQSFIRKVIESSALDKEEKERINNVGRELVQYRDALDSYIASESRKMETAQRANELSADLARHRTKANYEVDEMRMAQDVLVAGVSTYFNRPLESAWQRLTADLEKSKKAVDDWYTKIENSDELRAIGDTIKEVSKDFESTVSQYHAEVINQEKYQAQMNKHKEKIVNICTILNRVSAEKLQKQARSSLIWIFSVIGVALIIAILYSVVTTRRIVAGIKKVANVMIDGTGQIVAASGQVSSASQSLAEGASEQASSIEETSSSLEELASMTKQNADNAQESNSLTKEAGDNLTEINKKMEQLTTAVDDIDRNSSETQKIIKTIDEIAFQTNLLALNAAVEAARAGEAGAGFAVVAEEVRNLALRSAEAAKNTNELIGNTVKSVKEGARLSAETNEAFKKNAVIVRKTGELVSEVAAASQEQAQGIEQINKAVSEMDKVTQSNAANAEEFAAASEEMNAQAEGMKNVVGDLIAMVEGKNTFGRAVGLQSDGMMSVDRTRKPSGDPRKEEPLALPAHTVAKSVRSEEVIPMGGAAFKDF